MYFGNFWTVLRHLCNYVGRIILLMRCKTYTVQSAIVFEIRMIIMALVKGRVLFVMKFWALGIFHLARTIPLT